MKIPRHGFRLGTSLTLLGTLAAPVGGTGSCNFSVDGTINEEDGGVALDGSVLATDGEAPRDAAVDAGGELDAGSSTDAPLSPDAGSVHTWMSGFLMSAIVDDDYVAPSVDNAKDWYQNIGTWRTGSGRNNCTVFNANSYPDPGQAQTILDYNFGTHTASGWGPPARFVPSSVGLQPVWSTSLTRGDNYGLKDTNSGNADPNFRTWFTKLVSYGQGDAIIRLGWEMNGTWFVWGIGAPINTDKTTGYGSVDGAAAAYKSAFRHVVDIARSVPGQNFRFEWNSYFLDSNYGGVRIPASSVAAAYPGGPDAHGRDYVDFVGTDSYDESYTSGTPTVVQGNGSMASGSKVVTGWTGPSGRHFTGADVGKSIQVYTGGTNGGAATNYPLYAKIVSVDASSSPPTATLNAPARRAVSGAAINLFDAWPSAVFTNPTNGISPSLAAFAAFGRSKGKPLGISEWGPMLRMDGHGGNDDPAFIQVMYDFFADPANDVAYETLFQGIDGKAVGPSAQSIVYPLLMQNAGSRNGPFHDGTEPLPLSVAKYRQLFGRL